MKWDTSGIKIYREDALSYWDMVPEDIITLLPSFNSKGDERLKEIAVLYWVENKRVIDIARQFNLSRGRIDQLAKVYKRRCLHPSRRVLIKSKKEGTTE